MATKLYVSELINDISVVFVPGDGILIAEFDIEMHNERSDFECYANDPIGNYAFLSGEGADKHPEYQLLRNLLISIFKKGSGVEKISVKKYKLIIHHSRAVDVDSIADLVRKGMADPVISLQR